MSAGPFGNPTIAVVAQTLVPGERFPATPIRKPREFMRCNLQPLRDVPHSRQIRQGTLLQTEWTRPHARRFEEVATQRRPWACGPCLKELRLLTDRVGDSPPRFL